MLTPDAEVAAGVEHVARVGEGVLVCEVHRARQTVGVEATHVSRPRVDEAHPEHAGRRQRVHVAVAFLDVGVGATAGRRRVEDRVGPLGEDRAPRLLVRRRIVRPAAADHRVAGVVVDDRGAGVEAGDTVARHLARRQRHVRLRLARLAAVECDFDDHRLSAGVVHRVHGSVRMASRRARRQRLGRVEHSVRERADVRASCRPSQRPGSPSCGRSTLITRAPMSESITGRMRTVLITREVEDGDPLRGCGHEANGI